ncbi:ABC transporter permease, partial [Streptomyces sp. NPDC057757]
MTATAPAPTPSPGAKTDERLLKTSPWRKLMGRPELGSVVGAIAVFLFFAIFADSFVRAASLSTVLY